MGEGGFHKLLRLRNFSSRPLISDSTLTAHGQHIKLSVRDFLTHTVRNLNAPPPLEDYHTEQYTSSGIIPSLGGLSEPNIHCSETVVGVSWAASWITGPDLSTFA